MKKQIKVVMLPTEKASTIAIIANKLAHISDDSFNQDNSKLFELDDEDEDSEYQTIPQHLYLVSDEEIKEGDWFINEIAQLIQNKDLGDYEINSIDCKKVIATTDVLFGLNKHYNEEGKLDTIFGKQFPQIHKSFVKAYVEANGVIDEVMVEYEFGGSIKLRQGGESHMYKLKLRDDNTVIIHKVKKEMYSEEEVRKLIKSFVDYHSLEERANCSDKSVNKWIEENL